MTQQFHCRNDRFPVAKPTIFFLTVAFTFCANIGCQTTGTGLLSKGIFGKESPVNLDNYPPPSSVQTPVAIGSQAPGVPGQINNSTIGNGIPATPPAYASVTPPVGNGIAGNTGTANTTPIGSVQIPSIPTANQPAAYGTSNVDSGESNYEYAQQGFYSDPAPQVVSNQNLSNQNLSNQTTSPTELNPPPPPTEVSNGIVSAPQMGHSTAPYTVPDTPLNSPSPAATMTRNSSFSVAQPVPQSQPQPAQEIASSPGDSIYGSVPSSTQPVTAINVQSGTGPVAQYPVAQAIATEPVYAPAGSGAAIDQDVQSATIAPSAYEAAATAKSTSTAWRPGSTSRLK